MSDRIVEIKPVKPDNEVLNLLTKILEQNDRIITTNALIVNSFAKPIFIWEGEESQENEKEN